MKIPDHVKIRFGDKEGHIKKPFDPEKIHIGDLVFVSFSKIYNKTHAYKIVKVYSDEITADLTKDW